MFATRKNFCTRMCARTACGWIKSKKFRAPQKNKQKKNILVEEKFTLANKSPRFKDDLLVSEARFLVALPGFCRTTFTYRFLFPAVNDGTDANINLLSRQSSRAVFIFVCGAAFAMVGTTVPKPEDGKNGRRNFRFYTRRIVPTTASSCRGVPRPLPVARTLSVLLRRTTC